MKQWLPILFSAIFFTACGDSSPSPTVDVSGIWTGNWLGHKGDESGHLILDLAQQGAEVEGRIYLRYDLPSLINLGVRLRGKVEANRLSFQMDSSDNPHVFHGTVQGDGIMAGNIEYHDHQGTWSAKFISNHPKIQASQFVQPPFSWPDKIAADPLSLWIVSSVDGIHRLNHDGEILSTFQLDSGDCQGGISYCDGTLLCSNGGMTYLQKRSLEDGSLLDQWDIEGFMPGDLCCHEDRILATHWVTNELHAFDSSGHESVLGPVPGTSLGLAHDGHHLWVLNFYPDIMMRLDETGQVIDGYHLDFSESDTQVLSGLAFDGNSFWTTLTEYDDASPGEPAFQLVRFQLPDSGE